LEKSFYKENPNQNLIKTPEVKIAVPVSKLLVKNDLQNEVLKFNDIILNLERQIANERRLRKVY